MALADGTALARLRLGSVRAVLGPMLEEGRLAVCAITHLGVLHSGRAPEDYLSVLRRRRKYLDLAVTPDVCARAIEVLSELALRAQHREVEIAALLVAACAEIHDVPVLHYDEDFDLIASVTGQRCRWVVPPGSVP